MTPGSPLACASSIAACMQKAVPTKLAEGVRVPKTAEGRNAGAVYQLLYLPTDWNPSAQFPVIVEWT
jgi:hypothetical protein